MSSDGDEAKAAPAVSRFQKFDTVTIRRSEILNAPYNPRRIGKAERARLKKKIKAGGLVVALTWNARSGHLVAGHQRLAILDELEGGQDYSLTVCRIDVDEATEREHNVFLNNQSAMGEFDADLLGGMMKVDGGALDLGTADRMGFEVEDLQTMFDVAALFPEKKAVDDDAADDVARIQGMKDRRKEFKAQMEGKDDSEFYTVVVFQSRGECDRFLAFCEFDVDERYVDGARLALLLGLELRTDSDDPSQGTA